MKKLHHKNLVRLHEVIDDDENDKLYLSKITSINDIVMDYCERGEILKWDPKNLIFSPFDSSFGE